MANFRSQLASSLLFAFTLLSTNISAQTNELEPDIVKANAVEQKLNINQASYEQLIALKGIGPAKAKAILDYIERHGELVSLDELLEIRGIGQGLLTKLKLQIRL